MGSIPYFIEFLSTVAPKKTSITVAPESLQGQRYGGDPVAVGIPSLALCSLNIDVLNINIKPICHAGIELLPQHYSLILATA